MKERYETELRRLEKEYKTFDVCYKFIQTTRDDFDSEKSKKVIIKVKEMRYLLDTIHLHTRGEIQYGSQFSLRLTYNHIWCVYDEMKQQIQDYLTNKVIKMNY